MGLAKRGSRDVTSSESIAAMSPRRRRQGLLPSSYEKLELLELISTGGKVEPLGHLRTAVRLRTHSVRDLFFCYFIFGKFQSFFFK